MSQGHADEPERTFLDGKFFGKHCLLLKGSFLELIDKLRISLAKCRVKLIN